MPQIRLMGDDAAHVECVLEILLPLLATSPDPVVGDPTRLLHRSGGGRIVLDVSARRREDPIRVQVEATDSGMHFMEGR
ncbi:hypothetical protein [Streptosporangium saharense]|uniref:hypothetical protein n=1 Tax=Streptosporangium saharense TaxID=1706840 RepID=UPI00341CE100